MQTVRRRSLVAFAATTTLMTAAANATPQVSCELIPIHGLPGADLGGRYEYAASANGGPQLEFTSSLLVLGRSGEILEQIEIEPGEVFQLALRDNVVIVEHPSADLMPPTDAPSAHGSYARPASGGPPDWLVHAPGVLFRAIARDGSEIASAYCSPFTAFQVDFLGPSVFSASPNAPLAPAHITIGATQIDYDTLELLVDCVDIVAATNAELPGGPFSGSATVQGETFEIRDLTADPVSNTISFSLLGMPGGGHKVFATADPSYLDSLPPGWMNWNRPLGATEHEGIFSVFRVNFTSPSNGSRHPLAPISFEGVALHSEPIDAVRLFGRDFPTQIVSETEADSCSGPTVKSQFVAEIPVVDLARDFLDGDAALVSLDPGANFISAIAADSSGYAASARVRVIVGETAPSPRGVNSRGIDCEFPDPPDDFVPAAAAASLSEHALAEVARSLMESRLRRRAQLELSTLEGVELDQILVFDPCEGEPRLPEDPLPVQGAQRLALLPHSAPPILNPIGNRQVEVFDLLEIRLSATDNDDDELLFTAENLPPNSLFEGNNFGWQPHCDQVGVYDVTFRVTDGMSSDEETIAIRVLPRSADLELPFDITFETVEFDTSSMTIDVDLLDGPQTIETSFSSGEINTRLDLHKCLADWLVCWLSVSVKVDISFDPLVVTASLPADKAICPLELSDIMVGVDNDRSNIDVIVHTPDFGGVFGWLVDFISIPLRAFFTVGANIFSLFMDDYYLDEIEGLIVEIFNEQAEGQKLFPVDLMTVHVDLGSALPMTFSAFNRPPSIVSSDGTKHLVLTSDAAFSATSPVDEVPEYVMTTARAPSGGESASDVLGALSDDIVNQFFVELASTGILRDRLPGFAVEDFVSQPSPALLLLLEQLGIGLETPIVLSLDTAQDVDGNHVPPLFAIIDESGNGVEFAVRAHAVLRAVLDRGVSEFDDRALCSCSDIRPECQSAPCLLLEEVVKMNFLGALDLTTTSMGEHVIRYEINEIQILQRDQGYPAYEAVDLSSQQGSILFTTANSPLLVALLARINQALPALVLPERATTLDGTVVLSMFNETSVATDVAGLGLQDYLGLRADVTSQSARPLDSDRESRVARRLANGAFHVDLRAEATPLEIDAVSVTTDEATRPRLFPEAAMWVSPNPTTRTSIVTYTLERTLTVRVSVFDSRGRLVRNLAEGPQAAGLHSLEWDGVDMSGRRVAAGIYYYLLAAGSESAITKKVLIVR